MPSRPIAASCSRGRAAAGTGGGAGRARARRLPLLGRRGSGVAELARTLAISERALRRRFNDAIGYGPKKLDRIIRFRRLLGLTALRREDGLAAAAAELGYADQAHLTREVRELSGLTPVELLASI